jgi:hypothetical protein
MHAPGRPSIAWALVWRLGEPKTRVLLIGLLSPLLVMAAFTAAAAASGRPYGDFFAMWSFARFAFGHPAAQIYDSASLLAFQNSIGPSRDFSPFPYPPFYLLFLLPLRLLPIGAAWVLWTAGGLAAYLAAIFAGRRWNRALPFVLLSPASMVALASGQNGLFFAGLIIGGMRLLSERPLLAGVLLGLAAFKPQLGLVIPLALIAARAWRSLAAGAATILGLGIAATFAFGPGVWPGWLSALSRQWTDYVTEGNATRLKMPTITAALESAGASQGLALAAQAAALLAIAVTVWVIFRRRRDGLAIASLFAGCFVATPYALFYDMPLAAFAILLAVIESERIGFGWNLGEVVVLIVAYLAPYALFLIGISSFPIGTIALVMLFTVLARRALATPGQLAWPLDAAAQAS